MFPLPFCSQLQLFTVDPVPFLHFAPSTSNGRIYERKRRLFSLDRWIFDDGLHEVLLRDTLIPPYLFSVLR